MDNKGTGKLLPEHEKPGESHTESSTAQDELQGHEVVPDPGVTETVMQMETGVSVSGTVEMDSVGHGVGSEMSTAEIIPNLNEAMETCMSEQDRDQYPVEKDSTGREVLPVTSGPAEVTHHAEGKEEMESSVCEQNGDQHSDSEKRTVEKDIVSPLLGGGGSLALLGMQYRDGSSDDVSDR